MARRRTRSDIPTSPRLSQGIIDDPEELGNYITECIAATEWYGVPPPEASSDGTPSSESCLEAIIKQANNNDKPVVITKYEGREKPVIDAIQQSGEFTTSMSRALFYLYAMNPKIPQERVMCAAAGTRVKHVNCMSRVLDTWKRNLPASVNYNQIIQASDAILTSTKCARGQGSQLISCMSKVIHENENAAFIAQFMMMSGIDMTRGCGIATGSTREREIQSQQEFSCIQQMYESSNGAITQAFDYMLELPEVRNLLKRPIFFTPNHTVPITGYQYLIERVRMGDATSRIQNYFKPRTGIMSVRFLDEDPHRTGYVFTNPLDYIMRVYATDDPVYAKSLSLTQGERAKVLDVAFSSPEISEAVSTSACRVGDDMVPCIDAVISSNIAPGTNGQETMKRMAFNSIDLASARCISPAGTVSCLEKAIVSPGNFKYVKDAISRGSTNLSDARCGDTSCLDMIINGTARANVATKLGNALSSTSQAVSGKQKKATPPPIEVLGVPMYVDKADKTPEMDRSEAFKMAANVAYENAGPMGMVDEKERTELANIVISANASNLTKSTCHTLGMEGTVGGKHAWMFAADWATKTVTEGTFAQRTDVIKQSLTPAGSVSCMQRVFQIISTDPDTINKTTFDQVVFNPSVDLNTGGCYDDNIDRPASCMQASIGVAKKYGLHQWRRGKFGSAADKFDKSSSKRFFETMPSSDSDKDTADYYVNRMFESKDLQDMARPTCIDHSGKSIACLSTILGNKFNPSMPDELTFKIISSTKAFNAIKDMVVQIGGVDQTLQSVVCRDTAKGVRGVDRLLYRMKQSGRTLQPGDEGPAAEGSAVKYYGACHGCKDDGTFASRKCYDDICFKGIVADDFKKTMEEYYRDGTLYTNGKDILGISGVYKVKDPGQDVDKASKYIASVKEIERKVKPVLEDPNNYPMLKTKFKGKNAVVVYRGFSYPQSAEKLFEKDIAIKIQYISEEGDDTLGTTLYEKDMTLPELIDRKSPFTKILTAKNLVGDIDKIVKSKPSGKGSFLTMVVSTRAADLLRASTCQNWTSCVSLSANGAGMVPNSLSTPFIKGIGGYIAYIANNEFSPAWFARALITPVDPRKTDDADYPPKLAPCAYITPLKGLDTHKSMLASALNDLFYEKGINKGNKCGGSAEGSDIVGYDMAEERLRRAAADTKKNCISYNYEAELDKMVQGYEETFGVPAPIGMRGDISESEGKNLKKRAKEKCNKMHVRGYNLDDPEDLSISRYDSGGRQPIADEYIKFVPPGGLAALSYFPYLDCSDIERDSHISLSSGIGSVTESSHSNNKNRYGDEFVVRLREVAYE